LVQRLRTAGLEVIDDDLLPGYERVYVTDPFGNRLELMEPKGHSQAVLFKEIALGTDEYRRECRLREEVLREPLGLSLSAEDLAGEESQLHFCLFEPDDNLVACVIAAPVSPTAARIRQMAVAPAHQGKGLGRRVMHELEKNLRARGFKNLELDARATAVGFYEKLGYTVVGDEFIEVTVPHIRVVKAV
jgi:predicted GNAT family N-acyltransferase